MNELEQKIESLLFYKNEPVSFSWLGKILGVSIDDIKNTIPNMHHYYENRGLTLVVSPQTVTLMTHPEHQSIIQLLMDTEDQKELSKQALETLAIIVYQDGVTKSEIDYIRGVNSMFILRNLLIRGLVTKKQNPHDKRAPLYVPTHDMWSFLGITNKEDLPEYQHMKEQLHKVENEHANNETDTE